MSEENTFQAQAPICPFCFDDHSSDRQCEVRDLKRELIKQKLEHYANTDGENLKKDLERMIAYF